MGSAYVDYQNGYGVPFNEDPHVFPVSQLEKLIEKVNPSVEAQEYLQRTVFSALGMPELLGEKQIKLEGTVLNVFTQQGGTNKKGEAFEDRDKVQILGAMELPNGDVKNELFTLSVENYRDFSDF